jgi:hypothetical protein
MSLYCGECGQRLPQAKGMRCSVCRGPIKKGHRWQVVGSLVQHRSCENPRLTGEPAAAQDSFLEAEHVEDHSTADAS